MKKTKETDKTGFKIPFYPSQIHIITKTKVNRRAHIEKKKIKKN